MGVVYAVTSPDLPGERALKLLNRTSEVEHQLRFRREAELLASIRHPNVVAIHEVGEDPAGLFLVMDLVEGEPLDEILRRGPVSADQARAWILEVADAVSAIHAKGVLHRDLKPANLILRPDGHVVVLDFGLARSEGRSSLTETGAISGSPGFLAPEQARGETTLSPAVDVHGLGATLFALLTGEAPFRSTSILATLLAVTEDQAKWPQDLPADLAHVGHLALAKDPLERLPDASAFAAALRGDSPTRGDEASPGVPALALVSAVLAVLLLALGAWTSLPETIPSTSPPTATSTSASTPLPSTLPPLPSRREPWRRARWFRDAWGPAPAGQSPADPKKLAILRERSMVTLSTSKVAKARAKFWGNEGWVRSREFGLDWGGSQSPEALHRLDHGAPLETRTAKGALWAYQAETWSLWWARTPKDPLAPFPLATPDQRAAQKITALAIGEGRVALASRTVVWEVDLEEPRITKQVHRHDSATLIALGYTAGGDLYATSGKGQLGQVLSVRDGTRGALLDRFPDCIAFAPHDELIAIGDRGGRIHLWRPANPDQPKFLISPGSKVAHTRHVRGLAFSPSGEFLYSVAGKTTPDTIATSAREEGELFVWRRERAKWTRTRVGHLEWTPDRIDVSPNGAWLLISGREGEVELWAAGDASAPLPR